MLPAVSFDVTISGGRSPGLLVNWTPMIVPVVEQAVEPELKVTKSFLEFTVSKA